MKLTLVILLFVAVIFTRCAFKDAPQYELAEWKLLRIEDGSRDNKPIKIQVWEVNGVEVQITGATGYPIGIVIWWPKQK
jgi:hypothetical protein